jgi:TonB family protein
MVTLFFIAKLVISSGLLYGYYHLFLRNKRFHRYNRFYLLVISLISIVIPFIHIPVNLFRVNVQHSTLIQTLKVINANWEEPVIIYASQSNFTKWINIQSSLYFIYIAGTVTGFFILVRSLAWIKTLKRKYPHQTIDQLKIYSTTEPGTPFSFFRSIFWDEKISLGDNQGQQIFRHELFHVKEKHSADILLLEILCCACWFNPFYHLIKKEIRAIHEFLADEYAVSFNNRYEYAELLVLHAIKLKTPAVSHPFFHNQIKRRITMITQLNLVRRSGYISRIMALPLLFILVSAFAVKLSQKTVKPSHFFATKNITVVIDPGHGGKFDGSKNDNGLIEKNINLQIAQKIKELASQYNINIVLTRNTDELVGNASNLKEDLLNRIEITNKSKSDLFISIHVNATSEKSTARTGFEVYISKNENNKARLLSSTILSGLKDIYPADETIKQKEAGIEVLDHNVCPAIMIQCGYITNEKDVAFITDAGNQEKIARKILEGIVKYQQHSVVNFLNKDSIPDKNLAGIQGSIASKKNIELYPQKINADPQRDTVPHKTDSKEDIAAKVEVEAAYPGGNPAWANYLTKTLKYPEPAEKKKVQGTVIIQFIVDEDGKISSVKAVSGPQELRNESIRVIKESGNWTSAMNNGKKVKSYKKQPVTYRLS